MANWFNRIVGKQAQPKKDSFLRSLVAGSFYKVSSIRGSSSIDSIRTQIDTMRALANDSQISTALSYYATDATTTNESGQIIWATAIDPKHKEVADIINTKFKQMRINEFAREHILELATIGNLYIPTTEMYREDASQSNRDAVGLGSNYITDTSYDIIPSTKIPPETIIHLWQQGEPKGYVMQPDESSSITITYPETAIIHFSLGGLLGDYTIDGVASNGEVMSYDIKFGQPLMAASAQPTQTLTLLEDALLLSSLSRMVKFINVECGNAEEVEVRAILQQIKDMIEQQFSLNTANGDAQSFVNPQSPNNLIYLPKINGQDAISITDLNMAEATEADNKLLDYYQNKKLSVLGIPKEAMNFSSAEGLGGAGSVMSQRSALYANSLDRIETAYKAGWTQAFNMYFAARNLTGFVDSFELHMNPIITQMSTVSSERRDSALNQAQQLIDMMKSLGVSDVPAFKKALTEVLVQAFPNTGTEVASWNIDITAGGEQDAF